MGMIVFQIAFPRLVGLSAAEIKKSPNKSEGTYRYIRVKWISHDLRPPLLK